MINEVIIKLDEWIKPLVASTLVIVIIKISVWFYNHNKDKRFENKLDLILKLVKEK